MVGARGRRRPGPAAATAMSRETQTLGEEMSACLLQQSRFCVFGVIAGLPFSVRARSYWPFISLGIAGMGATGFLKNDLLAQAREALEGCGLAVRAL